MKAKDVMSTRVVTVTPQDKVHTVASKLLTYRISGAPVVDEHGNLVGIVSEGDMVRRVGGVTWK